MPVQVWMRRPCHHINAKRNASLYKPSTLAIPQWLSLLTAHLPPPSYPLPGARLSDPGLLWFLAWTAARLPFKRMDEPLALLQVRI
jgi:hypothetical protein